MENAPEAPAEAQKAPESEATPINSNPEPAQAPDMHGFTSDQLAEMQKFFESNGGFDKVKSKISNPEPKVEPVSQPAPQMQPSQPIAPQAPAYQEPEGSITQQEWMAREYFKALSTEEKYAPIAKEIASGELLKEMAGFNIQVLNQNGSINEGMVRKYLDLKAQTVPAKQTSSMPEASAAPTVDYIPVGESITSADQARKVIMQDSQLRRQGQAGHPSVKLAEDYLREVLSGKKK